MSLFESTLDKLVLIKKISTLFRKFLAFEGLLINQNYLKIKIVSAKFRLNIFENLLKWKL